MNNNRSTFIIFGGISAVILFALTLFNYVGSNPLDRSAIGTKGLIHWLQHNEIEAIESSTWARRNYQDISLRILPLYDTAFWVDRAIKEPRDKSARIAQKNQRRITVEDFWLKVSAAPTLVMLPKWRTGVNILGLAHKSLLIDKVTLSSAVENLQLYELELIRPEQNYTTLQYSKGLEIKLYNSQLFSKASLNESCIAILQNELGVLLAKCFDQDVVDDFVYILSDPDLLNNHGISLGDNVSIVPEIIQYLQGGSGKPVYLDLASSILLKDADNFEQEEEKRAPRTTEELSRFFEYPFSLLWFSAGLFLIIALWRGAIRFGGVRSAFADQLEASKNTSIEAKAFLLRLTGQDHLLAAEFVSNQMQRLSSLMFGAEARYNQSLFEQRLQELVPDAGPKLLLAANALYQAGSSSSLVDGSLSARIQNFNTQYRRVSDAIRSLSRHY